MKKQLIPIFLQMLFSWIVIIFLIVYIGKQQKKIANLEVELELCYFRNRYII